MYTRLINIAKHNAGANKSLIAKARELRKNMTDSEKILWNYLRSKRVDGFYFRRQHPFGIYILDFYCFEANLVIEIDGKIHLGRINYDAERTQYLIDHGLSVLRIKNEEVENRVEWVLQKIKQRLNIVSR